MSLIHKTVIYFVTLLILSSTFSIAAKQPVKPIKKAPASQAIKKKIVVKKPKPSVVKPKPVVVKPAPVVPEPVKQPVFTLESALYSLEPYSIADKILIPNNQQKLLIVEFSNPDVSQPDPAMALFKSKATDGSTSWSSSTIVKTPGFNDKLHLTAIFIVPASAKVAKVNLSFGDESTASLDLGNKITGFSAPLADSSDPAIPLARISAATGAFYPAGTLLLRLDKVGYTFGPIDGKQSADDARFITLDFTVKNPLASPLTITPAIFDTILEDADGALVKVKMSPASCTIESQKESIIRFYGQLATDNHANSFSIRQGNEGRQYIFDLNGVN